MRSERERKRGRGDEREREVMKEKEQTIAHLGRMHHIMHRGGDPVPHAYEPPAARKEHNALKLFDGCQVLGSRRLRRRRRIRERVREAGGRVCVAACAQAERVPHAKLDHEHIPEGWGGERRGEG